jgi:NAD+ diphosphatase
MVVSDGERCLLGQSRGRLSRTGTYSALAGFIDQGESIEEAVRREVREEAGIAVGRVRYHSSQPWPFPSSLMIGCHAKALTTDIHKDDDEMTDVRWFSRDEVLLALNSEHPHLRVPPPVAIAHHLIKAWARRCAAGNAWSASVFCVSIAIIIPPLVMECLIHLLTRA